MSSWLNWLKLCCLPRNTTTTTTTTTTTNRRKFKRLRKQLRKAVRMLQDSAVRNRLTKREKEFFDDFFTAALSPSHQFLGIPTTMGTTSVAPVTFDHICDGNYIFLLITPDRRQSKTLILSTDVDQKSERNRDFGCHLSPDWQQMATKNTVSFAF